MSTAKRPPKRPPARKAGQRRRAPSAHQNNDARRQLHALQVHQVELEMQNKELRLVREELDTSLARYTSLYESAPVGYLTLGGDGAILELNPAAAGLLGGGHREWRRARFDSYLTPPSRLTFAALLATVLQKRGTHDCEVEVQKSEGCPLWVQVSASYQAATESYLLALTDATARRDAFARVHDAEQLAQKLLTQNRHLTRRMFQLLEDDRRQIVHEIHDELGRWFFSVYEEIAAILRTEYRLQPETRTGIRTIMANLAEMQNGLRRILLRLRPTLLDMAGVGECVREYVAQWKDGQKHVQVDLTLDGDFDGIPDTINVTLFRVVQEALTNVAKHSHCGRVMVRLSRVGGQLNLVIDDNGDGFDTATVAPGVGLLGMRERILALDGQFELVSQPERGTRIEVYLPATTPEDGTASGPDA